MKLSDFDTLADAKAHIETRPKLIHRDSMNSLLASAGLYVALKGIALDGTNPFQNLIAAFLDSTEYNFIIGTSTGDRQIAALDAIIANGGDFGNAIAAIKPTILAMANPEVKPYESATKHDFEKAKNTISRKLVTVENGYCSITTTADVESHNPQIYKEITFSDNTTKLVRVAGFSNIEKAGLYRTQCPSSPFLYIDNAYNVVA